MSENRTLATIRTSKVNRTFHGLPVELRRIALEQITQLAIWDEMKAKKIVAKIRRSN